MIGLNDNLLYMHVYNSEDILPVKINSLALISDDEISELVRKYNNAGFVVFELLNDIPNQNALLTLAKKLKLGNPYVPKIYSSKENIYERNGLNIIKVNEGPHRAFQTNNEQKIHSDGTIEEIGKIKTSILLCSKQASFGGETVIFNSVSAFYRLLEHEKLEPIILSLCDLKALRRVAINGEKEEYIGPAFEIRNGEIISRFSLDNTCDWEYGFNNVKFLKEAYSLLVEMNTPNSPLYIETRLKCNQGIIMANDKVSHGRKEFIDENSMREMIRGLFEENLRVN
ncbi:TauD/TfdA family dioxygenase [Bacillus sp. sid0103]|uniref:TauD/TfdA family dioxygenase n=1 Tax=Bacillus sp. sid0103 TaxID=2856337 RepID=UPI001C477FCA|nr:TauD/TfdA family dioxygenase [Bacillus sp. sid0103]MBV7509481.1 TauD/TfdA family dioxygenase [Bacillus sp. sid0103]